MKLHLLFIIAYLFSIGLGTACRAENQLHLFQNPEGRSPLYPPLEKGEFGLRPIVRS